MSNIDWSKLITYKMKQDAKAAAERAKAVILENKWRDSEILVVKDNLEAIYFGDESALAGTEAEWKSYGVKLRSWKEGNVDFPNTSKRPSRPK